MKVYGPCSRFDVRFVCAVDNVGGNTAKTRRVDAAAAELSVIPIDGSLRQFVIPADTVNKMLHHMFLHRGRQQVAARHHRQSVCVRVRRGLSGPAAPLGEDGQGSAQKACWLAHPERGCTACLDRACHRVCRRAQLERLEAFVQG